MTEKKTYNCVQNIQRETWRMNSTRTNGQITKEKLLMQAVKS